MIVFKVLFDEDQPHIIVDSYSETISANCAVNFLSCSLFTDHRQSIVGKAPFDTIGSVVGVSLFVLITSQLLGNVAVVQLAKPNVEVLDDEAKGIQIDPL